MKQETRNRKQETRVCLVLLIILFFPICVFCEEPWKLLFQPRQRIVKTIGVYKDQIFAGTGNGVFISKDQGKTWQDFGTNKLQKDNNGTSTINWIYLDKLNNQIYIATNFGAYYSNINEPDWHKLFESTKTGLDVVDSTTEDIDS